MKILITGVTGFLGTHLVKQWENKFELIGIMGQTNQLINNSKIKLYKSSDLVIIEEKPDVIVLCHAAISSGNQKKDNLNLFKANVEFTEKISLMFPDAYQLYVSSVSVYGNNSEQLNELSDTNPKTEYAISKFWGEKIIKNKSKSGILRLSSLYGVGMKENTIIPIYIDQALRNKKIEVWGNGARKQNYIHIDDAVLYIEKIVLSMFEGIYLGISQTEISNIELANIVSNYTDSQIIFLNSDHSVSMSYNNSFTKNKFNINSEINFTRGIQDYISWKKRQF